MCDKKQFVKANYNEDIMNAMDGTAGGPWRLSKNAN